MFRIWQVVIVNVSPSRLSVMISEVMETYLCVSTLFLLLIKCDLCLQGRCKARATAGRRRYEQWESFCFSFACKLFHAFTPPQLYIVLFFVLVCATEW